MPSTPFYVINATLFVLLVLALIWRHFLLPSLCADTTEVVGQLGEDVELHCADAVWMCSAEGHIGEHMRLVCPSTCGLCHPPFEVVCSDSPNAIGTRSGTNMFCKDVVGQCAKVDTSISEQCPSSCGLCRNTSGLSVGDAPTKKLETKDPSVASGKGRAKSRSLKHKQPAVAQVKCDVCKYLVQSVVNEKTTLDDEFEAVVANVCDRRTAFSRWMLFFDIRLEGQHLEIHEMEQQGVCGRECGILQQACSEIMRNGRDALEDMVASGATPSAVVQKVCDAHCQSRQPFLLDEWEDEPFKPEKQHVMEAELQNYRRQLEQYKDAARGRREDDFADL